MYMVNMAVCICCIGRSTQSNCCVFELHGKHTCAFFLVVLLAGCERFSYVADDDDDTNVD